MPLFSKAEGFLHTYTSNPYTINQWFFFFRDVRWWGRIPRSGLLYVCDFADFALLSSNISSSLNPKVSCLLDPVYSNLRSFTMAPYNVRWGIMGMQIPPPPHRSELTVFTQLREELQRVRTHDSPYSSLQANPVTDNKMNGCSLRERSAQRSYNPQHHGCHAHSHSSGVVIVQGPGDEIYRGFRCPRPMHGLWKL